MTKLIDAITGESEEIKDGLAGVAISAPLGPSLEIERRIGLLDPSIHTEIFIHETDRLLKAIDRHLAGQLKLPPIAGAAAGAWTFTNASRTNMLNGTWDFDTDTFLCALFLSTSNIGAASTTYAGVTNEHASANGYTTGGISMGALTLAGTTTVTVDDPADLVWTAVTGNIVARFAVIYESGGAVLCYALLDATPADVTITPGNTLTIALSASGIFTLA